MAVHVRVNEQHMYFFHRTYIYPNTEETYEQYALKYITKKYTNQVYEYECSLCDVIHRQTHKLFTVILTKVASSELN